MKKVFFVSHVYYSNATDLQMSGFQWACCMYIQDSSMRNSQIFNVTIAKQMLISLLFGDRPCEGGVGGKQETETLKKRHDKGANDMTKSQVKQRLK